MNILAIGAHPDDVEFGCGGTLIRYSRAGHKVNLMVLTSGSYGGDPAIRMREQEEAAKYLGAVKVFWGGFNDTELHDGRPLISKIEEAVSLVKPDVVFINYPEDVHQDHRAAANAGMSATRYVKEVIFFEVPTTQNFPPGMFVDIGKVLPDKLKLLEYHSSQINRTRVENLTILESVQACATFRGFQGRVKYAEGFKALRILRDIV
jgi:LmbE family N-acetylglucosaminyl deacetylase